MGSGVFETFHLYSVKLEYKLCIARMLVLKKTPKLLQNCCPETFGFQRLDGARCEMIIPLARRGYACNTCSEQWSGNRREVMRVKLVVRKYCEDPQLG
jgi:hypothetical protein